MLTRLIFSTGVVVTFASSAVAAPIDVTFDFDTSNPDSFTTGATGGGSATDSDTGETLTFTVGYFNNNTNAEDSSISSLALGNNNNGGGVNTPGLGGNSGTELESQIGTGNNAGAGSDEFIEFVFPKETTLVSIQFFGLGNPERFTYSVDGGAAVTVVGTDLTGELLEFPASTTVNPGGTLRITAIDQEAGGETLIRLQDLNVQIVPEPGSAAALGLVGLVGLRRRR
ncbi:MAG: PEP-CTERM sorting domain-containing protein [Planctomycetota bacterium]